MTIGLSAEITAELREELRDRVREHFPYYVDFRQRILDLGVEVPENLEAVVDLTARLLSDDPFSQADRLALEAAGASVIEHGADLAAWARDRARALRRS